MEKNIVSWSLQSIWLKEGFYLFIMLGREVDAVVDDRLKDILFEISLNNQ